MKSEKIQGLGWRPKVPWKEGIKKTSMLCIDPFGEREIQKKFKGNVIYFYNTINSVECHDKLFSLFKLLHLLYFQQQ